MSGHAGVQYVQVGTIDATGHFIPTTLLSSGVTGALVVANNTVVAPGRSIQITAAGTISTATLTLSGGSTIDVTLQVGDNVYPYQVTKLVKNSGTISGAWNLT